MKHESLHPCFKNQTCLMTPILLILHTPLTDLCHGIVFHLHVVCNSLKCHSRCHLKDTIQPPITQSLVSEGKKEL